LAGGDDASHRVQDGGPAIFVVGADVQFQDGGVVRSDLAGDHGLEPDDDHGGEHDWVDRSLRHRPVGATAVDGDPHAVGGRKYGTGASRDLTGDKR
jgi:hypothetical protein